MEYFNNLRLRCTKKLWPWLNISKSTKFKVKVTRSKVMVLHERSFVTRNTHVKYKSPIYTGSEVMAKVNLLCVSTPKVWQKLWTFVPVSLNFLFPISKNFYDILVIILQSILLEKKMESWVKISHFSTILEFKMILITLWWNSHTWQPIQYIYRISGNFGVMEILALLADDNNTPN